MIDPLDASPRPTILILQQKFPSELANKVGLAGSIMTTAMQSVGCLGVISNGPSRDIDAIREMGFQYMLSRARAGHGAMAVQAVNVPVHVAGMDVAPGELIHMEENGACKFPADKTEVVAIKAKALIEEEDVRLAALRKAKAAAEIGAIFSRHSYSQDEQDKEEKNS